MFFVKVNLKSGEGTPIKGNSPCRKRPQKEFVWDIRAINDIVQDIHPTVSNPYTLVNNIPRDSLWYSVLDLKDAFFCILVDQGSQLLLKLLAFEWQDLESWEDSVLLDSLTIMVQ